MSRFLFLSLVFAGISQAKCYKTIETVGYNEQLILNQNVIRIKCKDKDEEIKLDNRYAKYFLKQNEYLTLDKIVEIKPGKVIFKVNENISFTTLGKVVATYDGYVKVIKPNKEIKKYRIK